jgi:TetR/AcrR family transcriptional regulator, transcriptional repressor for nem operon
MASKHVDTREEILKVASHFVQTRGFSAFSFGHIAEQLDIKPPAIHYHFSTKADLGVALATRYRARYQRWITEAADQGLAAPACIEGYFRIATRTLEDHLKVCPVGILASEYGALPEAMQQEVSGMVHDITDWLNKTLARGARDGSLKFQGTAKANATLVVCALQGALQDSRMLGRKCFDDVVTQLRLQLGMD